MKPQRIVLVFCIAVFSIATAGQSNGKLQIHYMDVNQGDGALLISPDGQTVLFDNGVLNDCEKPVAYLRSLGITKIDYMIISHYHSDHFGCTTKILDEFPLQVFSYDRPGAYNSKNFRDYVKAVGAKRKQVHSTTKIILDKGTGNEVRINVAGYNGAGVSGADDENDRSVAAVIHFGDFDAMMAGDLSGYTKKQYTDVETVVSKKIGQVEVYKVNHHGSEYSSNPVWLKKLSPRIAIISAGVGEEMGSNTLVRPVSRITDAYDNWGVRARRKSATGLGFRGRVCSGDGDCRCGRFHATLVQHLPGYPGHRRG